MGDARVLFSQIANVPDYLLVECRQQDVAEMLAQPIEVASINCLRRGLQRTERLDHTTKCVFAITAAHSAQCLGRVLGQQLLIAFLELGCAGPPGSLISLPLAPALSTPVRK
jgi:hypothetical protein